MYSSVVHELFVESACASVHVPARPSARAEALRDSASGNAGLLWGRVVFHPPNAMGVRGGARQGEEERLGTSL